MCSYICFVAFFATAFAIAHIAGNTYTVTTDHRVLQFATVVLSNQTLNSLGPLLSNGTAVDSRPSADHSGQLSYNPFDTLIKSTSFSYTISTGVIVSLVGVICFVGYALLSVYLGNGLIMLPYNLVFKWWQRPKKLTYAEMMLEQKKMQRKLRKMIDSARELKSRLWS